MLMFAIALNAALSGLPDITWERDRAEDAHQLTLCRIHLDQLSGTPEKREVHQQAKAICDLLARDYKEKWDFDAQDALAAQAQLTDWDALIRRGDVVEVPYGSVGDAVAPAF